MVVNPFELIKLTVLLVFFTNNVLAKLNFKSSASSLSLQGVDTKLFVNTSTLDLSGTVSVSGSEIQDFLIPAVGSKIVFGQGGHLLGKDSHVELVGSVVSGGQILLSGNNSLHVAQGEVSQQVIVSGKNNVISGSPVFLHPIVMQDADAELFLDLSCKLSNNLVLNGGSLKLIKDLSLKDHVSILGGGNVDLKNYSLNFPSLSNSFDDPITFSNANDIVIQDNTTLNTTWFFLSNPDNITNYAGVVLSFTNKGYLCVLPRAALYLSDINLNWLSSSGGGFNILGSGKVYLSNCLLNLNGTYTHSNGQLIFDGTDCKVSVQQGEQFIIKGSGASLVVDGTILWYDNLGSFPENPFVTQDGGQIILLNGGEIRSTFIPASPKNITITNSQVVSEANIDLVFGTTMRFSIPVDGKSIVFDGQGNSIRFSSPGSQNFIVDPDLTLELRNLILYDFDFSQISLGLNSQIVFGDGVKVLLNKDLSLSLESFSLNVQGNVEICGNQSCLTIDDLAVSLDNSATLTISNLDLILLGSNAISVNNDNCKCVFKNTNLLLGKNGFIFNTGSLDFVGQNKITGAEEVFSDFTFSSGGFLRVLPNTILQVGPHINFIYSPAINNDASLPRLFKRHIVFQDLSSTLLLFMASLDVTLYGMAIDNGKVLIKDHCSLKASTNPVYGFELSKNANFTICGDGYLEADGSVIYT